MNQKVTIFNNLTRSKLPFVPIKEGEVLFYSCGPTTYDFLHVGNARAFVVGDLINRIFKALDYKVTFARNFTDVDDKIINRANELKIDPLKHSAVYIAECEKDMDSLGMLQPDHAPKVSETMPEIIRMIEVLMEKNFAYEVDGEVFFHVPMFKDYGKLSKKKLSELEHGKRVEVDKRKKHSSDFVLWKPAKPGEPSWDSPWSKGRPGWHIECSAMIKKILGDTIDIHHGGVDLMFPHHENEIAQSEAANGRTFVNYWCHNEFLNFGSEKMSKSLGNVVTIRQFIEKFSGEVLRQLLSIVHYRTVMVWSDDAITRAINDVERIHKFMINFEKAKKENLKDDSTSEMTGKFKGIIPKMKKNLASDFNVPGAMALFFSMIRQINREFLDEQGKYEGKNKLGKEMVDVVEEVISFTKLSTGLIHDNPELILNKINEAKKNFSVVEVLFSNEEIEKLVTQRTDARNSKNWALADEIRDKLGSAGITIKDNPDGTVGWSYK